MECAGVPLAEGGGRHLSSCVTLLVKGFPSPRLQSDDTEYPMWERIDGDRLVQAFHSGSVADVAAALGAGAAASVVDDSTSVRTFMGCDNGLGPGLHFARRTKKPSLMYCLLY